MALFDDDFFSNDKISSDHFKNIVVEAETEVKSFKCEHCAKICYSKQGLFRHGNAKHKGEKEDPLLNKAEMKLHQGVFWKFVKDSAAKLAEDDCYSDTTKQVFSNFSLTLEESLLTST